VDSNPLKISSFNIQMKKYIQLLAVLILFASCSKYQKALNSTDVALKFDQATKKYEAKKYYKAIRLFEQLAPSYKGKPQAEKMFYMFAQSYYNTKQFYLAAYQFESFASSYPKSEKREEASFLSAKCYSKLSPVSSLDQVDTYKALDKMQEFIDRYPDSQYMQEANAVVFDLKNKLEKKAFDIAKQYNTISDYKSAIASFDNFLSDFPGTPLKEEALYYKFESCYNLAINSVFQKMEERLSNAKTAHANLMKFKADTKYKEKADEMLARIDKDLQQFSK
jgi:outer membrane protein assembly factor BamD